AIRALAVFVALRRQLSKRNQNLAVVLRLNQQARLRGVVQRDFYVCTKLLHK
ncbi:MAG: hypothetical protein ACI9HK_006285, partial [Pirellulaceae bacterium]